MPGKLIVLAASTTETTGYQRSTWRRMLLAMLPARYARVMGTGWSTAVEVNEDGAARAVPNGLRVIVALLARRFGEENIAVCYPDRLHRFAGPESRAIGIHAHSPECYLRRKLYLDFTGRRPPRYSTPAEVPIPAERRRPELPVLS